MFLDDKQTATTLPIRELPLDTETDAMTFTLDLIKMKVQ